MTEPLTPSLRAEPLMIVCSTFREADRMAHDLGLRRQEWRHVREIRHVQGLRQGRYTICGHEWPWRMIEVMHHMQNPSLSFRHLPRERVRKLVLRDRAAESE